MASEPSIRRYRSCYAKLLRLYPKHYRAHFGEGMEQTFNDLCRERLKTGEGLFSFAFRMFCETAVGILKANATTVMQKKIIVRPAIGAGLIVLIPLALTLLGKWGWHDPRGYVLCFVLLFATGLTYELVARKMANKAYRFAVGLAVVAGFVFTWMNMVRTTESENPANWLNYSVLVIGACGAAIVRFEPRGMARVLFATALLQLLIPGLVYFFTRDHPGPNVQSVIVFNVFFATLFVASALLFRHASARKVDAPK